MTVRRVSWRERYGPGARLVLAALWLTGCAQTAPAPQSSQPDPKPEGWIQDFDYQTSLPAYLRQQYLLAREEGKTAYVYIYSDHPHCRMTRELASGPIVGAAYSETRIVMLDELRLQWQRDNSIREHGRGGLWLPAIIRIHPDGGLDAEAMLFPDLYQFHPERVSDPPLNHYSLGLNWVPMRAEIAARISAFFDRNDRNSGVPGAD